MRLRKLEERDAILMLEWMHDRFVVNNLKTDFANKTINDCLNFIKSAQDITKNVHLAIVNEKDEYMGTVSLKNIKENSAEFGIVVRKCAMGKEFAKYGIDEILRIGLEEMGLSKIYWCVSPENIRACRFYDKHKYIKCYVPSEAEGYSKNELDSFIWYQISNEK